MTAIAPASPAKRGVPFDIRLRYGRVPPGAAAVVELERAGGPKDLNKYDGPIGPIGKVRLPLRQGGLTHIRWDASTVGCSPEDYPTSCPIAPGRYRFRVVLYPHGKFSETPFLGSGRIPKAIAESRSEPFVILGEPDLPRLQRALRDGASAHVRSLEIARGHWMMGRSDWFVDEGERFRNEARGWCMDFKPKAPIRGNLTACAPKSVVSADGLQIRELPLEFAGDLVWPQEVVSHEQAWKSALRLVPNAEALGYQGWPPTAGGAGHSISASQYRADLSAWLVMIHVSTGATSSAVVVRVENDGSGCIVARLPGTSLRTFEELQARCP